jgi:Tol biopolymer transport system component
VKPRPVAIAIALALGSLYLPTCSASASVEPGTPVAVAPGVPDQGRVWELVTSPDPVSASLWSIFAISPDGDRVLYSTLGLLPDAPVPEPLPSPAVAIRSASGWSNATIPPPPEISHFFEPGPVAIAPDFESSIWASEIESTFSMFRSPRYGEYTQLLPSKQTFPAAAFIGASLDTQRLAVKGEKHLLPADASRTSGASIYEVDGSELSLVDVDNTGTLLSDCGSRAGGPSSISEDGRRIFFATSPGCSGTQRVFLRANGATTTEISASQCDLADCGPEADVSFAGATPSGSVAFLATKQRLSDEDTDSGTDLYRYDVASGDLTLVSTDLAGHDLTLPGEPEEVHVSVDGSRAYFKASEETGPGETSAQQLYMADASGPHLVSSGTPQQFFQISPDGRYAVFATAAPLLAGDSDESLDVYRYDADSSTLTLVSAGPQGGNGAFDAKIEPASFPAAMVADHPYRAMSDDASRIFFTTAERLLPEDRNEVADVYEWANGDLGLISSGGGDQGSSYGTSTPDGGSVLFMTAETLLPGDRDGGDVDFYVARIGGGFPQPPAAASCSDPCGTGSAGRLARPAPASARAPGKGIRLEPIDAAERRRIAASGWIALLAEVPKAGRLAAQARARVGGRERTVAAAAVKVAQPGPVQLRMRLSKAARQSLARGGSLDVRLGVRLSGLASVRRVSFELEAGP